MGLGAFGVLLLCGLRAVLAGNVKVELLVTIPVEIAEEKECFCCAFLNSINSSLAVRQSAAHFCSTYNETARRVCVPSLVVDRRTCEDRVTAAFLQRLRTNEEGLLLPVKVETTELYFYARSAVTLEQDVSSFCAYHGVDHLGCRTTLHARAQALLTEGRGLENRPSVPKDADASRVYLWPIEHADGFVRERLTLQEGLFESRRVVQVAEEKEADYVLYLLTGPISTSASPLDGRVASSRLVCLDYTDAPLLPPGLTSACRVVFKRSWVVKEEGALVGYPAFTRESNVFPLHYAAISHYFGPQVEYAYRDVSVTCTLRPTTVARRRVLNWVTEAVMSWGLEDAFMGQYSDSVRHTVDPGYRRLLGRSRVIVTANPDGWDGDMRTWEALASGALVLVDACYTPFPPGLALIDRQHIVVYDNRDRASLLGVLRHYLDHPEEAAAIAKEGQRFALRHHRASSRLDYIDEVTRGEQPLLYDKEWVLVQQGLVTTMTPAADEEEQEEEGPRQPPWADDDHRLAKHRGHNGTLGFMPAVTVSPAETASQSV